MSSPAPPLWSSFALDGTSPSSIQEQVADHFRQAILQGLLRPGTRLPSTRTLAAELKVARQTVVAAYDRLSAEGYVEGRHGSGTRVSRVLPEELLGAPSAPAVPQSVKASMLPSRRGREMASLAFSPSRRGPAALLAPGNPALDAFPYRVWERLSAETCRSQPVSAFGYGDPAGFRPLRQAIADHLRMARGLSCEPEQIIVTSGSQQAIDLAARVLLDPGDAAWVEDPAYLAGRHALDAAGLRTVPVPVDGEGIGVEAGRRLAPEARLALVTPSHQHPLGVVMSLPRRLALLDWAERTGSWIVEDDYDSEFRYDGRPLPPLAALGRSASRILYVGTFSKVLAPGLRIGYLIAPPALAEVFLRARALSDRQSSGPIQAILAAFMAEGHLAAHIRRMRVLYQERRDALMAALASELGNEMATETPSCGLHLVGYLTDSRLSDEAVYAKAFERGVQTPPLSAFYKNPCPRPGLILGFASTPSEAIPEACRRLAAAIQAASRPQP